MRGYRTAGQHQQPDQQAGAQAGGEELDRLKALAQDARHIRFTGWVDVDLTEKGRAEAERGGALMVERGMLAP